MTLSRRSFLSASAALAVLPQAARAQAPGWPGRGVTLVVGYAAGGTVDFGARVLAEELRERLGVSVTVENRPGASGTIGGSHVAKSAPDGYTLLVAGQPETAMLKSTKLAPPYEVMRDLAPLAMVMDYPYLLVVSPAINAKSWSEFVAFAKAKGGDLNYASPGAGTTPHLIAEHILSASGLHGAHVPYQGATAFRPDLMSGRVDFAVDSMPSILPLVRDGKVRAIAVTTKEREPKTPDVATCIELGLFKDEYTGWVGLFAPKATPEPVQKRVIEATFAALKGNGAARIAASDFRPGSPAQKPFGEVFKAEEGRWGEIMKRAGLQPT